MSPFRASGLPVLARNSWGRLEAVRAYLRVGRWVRQLVLPLLLAACSDPGPQWKGWLYPDADNLPVSRELGLFQTFEQCQAAAIAALRELPDPDGGAYECGRRCRFDGDLQTEVCAETRD